MFLYIGDEDYVQQQQSRSSRADAGGTGGNLLEESKLEPQHTQLHPAMVCDFSLIYMYVCVRVRACVCVCVYIYIYNYIHIYMYTYIHICTRSNMQGWCE